MMNDELRMMNRPHLFLGLLFLLLQHTLAAQVISPDFICVKSDTLIWEIPTNTCGNFNSYDIFISQSKNGPYEILTTISDPNQTNFVHEESVTGRFFYYLQTNADCPGQEVLSSDTLDNRLPELVNMQSVSVENNAVVVSWEASNSPEVTEYIVYRDTEMGTVPIATTTNLSYTDNEVDPQLKTETYYVLAGDACDNTSIFPDPQNTILLEGSGGNGCDSDFTLTWNLYQNWQHPIERHEIWVSINGAIAEPVDEVTGNISSYIFMNTTDQSEYCFFIKTVESVTGNTANSSEICLTANIVQGDETLFLESASVTPDNQVELGWSWNINADLSELQIFSSRNEEELSLIETQSLTSPLTPNPTYLDVNSTPTEGSVIYQLRTIDECGIEVSSNRLSTIYLSGMAQPDQTNLLNWDFQDLENIEIENFELFKIVGTETEAVGIARPPINSLIDAVDPNNLAEVTAQYYVIATVILTLPDGTLRNIQVRSNTLVIAQQARVQTPNAFAPHGRNREFRPVVTFGETADYQLVIYNRYGGIVFETTDFRQGWDGRDVNGKMNNSGTYVYHIRIIQPDGSITEETGTVTLLL